MPHRHVRVRKHGKQPARSPELLLARPGQFNRICRRLPSLRNGASAPQVKPQDPSLLTSTDLIIRVVTQPNRPVCSLTNCGRGVLYSQSVLNLAFACASASFLRILVPGSYSCIARTAQTSNTPPCHLPSSNPPRFRRRQPHWRRLIYSYLVPSPHSSLSKKRSDEILDTLCRQFGVVGRCSQACATRGKRNSWPSRTRGSEASHAGPIPSDRRAYGNDTDCTRALMSSDWIFSAGMLSTPPNTTGYGDGQVPSSRHSTTLRRSTLRMQA
jgi:hypothetical protein